MEIVSPTVNRDKKQSPFNLLACASCAGSLGALTLAVIVFFAPTIWMTTPVGLIVASLAAFGLLSGLVSLVSMRRYGRRGILMPATVGVSTSGLLAAVLVVAALTPYQQLEPATHAPNAQYFQYSRRGFRLDLPDGFKHMRVDSNSSGVNHYFVNGDPNDNEPDMSLFISEQPGRLIRGRLTPDSISKDFKGVTTQVNWRGLWVNMARWTEKKAETSMANCLVQLPLKDELVTLVFEGPAIREDEVLKIATNTLPSVEGDTSW